MLSLRRIADAVAETWRFFTGESDAARDAVLRVFEDSADFFVVIAEDGHILAASRSATQMLVGSDGRLVDRLASAVLPEAMLVSVQRAFADGRVGTASARELAQVGDPNAGGFVVQYMATLSELAGRGALPRRFVGLTFWDETERRRREQELVFIGTHDRLTGALTRAELIRIVNDAMSTERRRSSGLTLLMLDLKRFKAVNDTLGHGAGDQVLKQVVSRLKAAGIETVSRLSGDAFAMIRHGRLTDADEQTFCTGLLERISLPYSVGGNRAVIGGAIGLTHTEVSGFDAEQLLSHAEVALTVAKAMPGNAHVRFTLEMDLRLRERQTIDLALRHALERQQLTVTYQPQVELETGGLVGVEALVRWQHPDLGIVPPDIFISAAEDNGEIVEIGRWVLQTACREVAAWPFSTRLAVNVSPVQFELVDIVAEVKEALRLSGLQADRLDIEITESIFLSNAEHVADAINRLRAMGVGVALDDFGTGYSSLGYLVRLPVDKIKIDQAFVRSLPADPAAGAIVRAVMTLSETLNKVVVAEGVETADQAWMLRMMGCRIGQGYHFGRARSSSGMASWHDTSMRGVGAA